MTLTVYTEPTNVATLTGALSIIQDPQTGDAGNLTVAGALTATGLATLPSNVNVGGNVAASGNVTATGNLNASGNLTVAKLATIGELGGGVLGGGAGGSAVSLAAGGTVTIGSNVRVVRISVAAIAGAINMPTDSVDGRDITVLNAGTAALTIVTNCGVSVAIASGASAGFTWDVASTLWYHKA